MPKPFDADEVANRLFNSHDVGWEDIRDALLAAHHAGAREMRQRAAYVLNHCHGSRGLDNAWHEIKRLPLTAPESEAKDEQAA